MTFFATWHPIEVQYEGGHEGSLDGEDGDGVGEHHAVGVVQADDHLLGQRSRVGKLHKKGKIINLRSFSENLSKYLETIIPHPVKIQEEKTNW